jgi:hypothetical protein
MHIERAFINKAMGLGRSVLEKQGITPAHPRDPEKE